MKNQAAMVNFDHYFYQPLLKAKDVISAHNSIKAILHMGQE